jgi:hypothetical protein
MLKTADWTAEEIELWLTYTMFKQNEDSIQTQAYSFWKNRGFAIELSGVYETDYGSLINKGIQK